jgi:hypothetical protein
MRNLRLVTTIAFMLACLMLIPVLVQCLPGHPWEMGTDQHKVIQTLWAICSAFVFLIIYRQGQLKDNLIGTILLILFGPISLLSLAFIGLYYKFMM